MNFFTGKKHHKSVQNCPTQSYLVTSLFHIQLEYTWQKNSNWNAHHKKALSIRNTRR